MTTQVIQALIRPLPPLPLTSHPSCDYLLKSYNNKMWENDKQNNAKHKTIAAAATRLLISKCLLGSMVKCSQLPHPLFWYDVANGAEFMWLKFFAKAKPLSIYGRKTQQIRDDALRAPTHEGQCGIVRPACHLSITPVTTMTLPFTTTTPACVVIIT